MDGDAGARPPTLITGTTRRQLSFDAVVARRVAVAGALALALFAAGPSAASAGQYESIDTDGGFVAFNDAGEVLFVQDQRGEGYRVVAQLRLRNGAVPISEVTDRDGADGNPNSNDLALREDTNLSLRMCYEERLGSGAHVVVSCSRWQDAEA